MTHGAIGANSLVYQALVAAGDCVVTIVPNYQQHYSIPESLGAEVKRLQLRAENEYLPDMDELRKLVTPGNEADRVLKSKQPDWLADEPSDSR